MRTKNQTLMKCLLFYLNYIHLQYSIWFRLYTWPYLHFSLLSCSRCNTERGKKKRKQSTIYIQHSAQHETIRNKHFYSRMFASCILWHIIFISLLNFASNTIEDDTKELIIYFCRAHFQYIFFRFFHLEFSNVFCTCFKDNWIWANPIVIIVLDCKILNVKCVLFVTVWNVELIVRLCVVSFYLPMCVCLKQSQWKNFFAICLPFYSPASVFLLCVIDIGCDRKESKKKQEQIVRVFMYIWILFIKM